MILAVPWALAALAALPLLWWLLRVTPPAPRAQDFPAVRLLAGLPVPPPTPARTPPWLLALRLLAGALVILALARPVLDAGAALPGNGPVLLVVDNGFASAADWPQRMQAARGVLDRIGRSGRGGALLATASGPDGQAPRATPVMPASELRARLAALRPQPWPSDRAGDAAALATWRGSSVYVADGLTDGRGFAPFAGALRAAGPVTEICCAAAAAPGRVLLPPLARADGLVARIAQVPVPVATTATVFARAADGRTLDRATIDVPPGAATAQAAVKLPAELRNRLARLVLDGPPSAASVALLDDSFSRRPVGLVAGNQATADAPLLGPLFYLRRALGPYAELREGAPAAILARAISVVVLADRPEPPGAEAQQLAQWVERGGMLVRFAGPRMAEAPEGEADALLPVDLLRGDRTLGGALTWSKPAALAPFPQTSPFAGLPVPPDVRVVRQVLAQPTATLADHTWARLADGTPLVTETPRGAGRIVLFHVTANADWSNLPLSGLFVDMLRRLVAISAGVAPAVSSRTLAPARALDGFGVLGPPPPAAAGLRADALTSTPVSPAHPPGLYGPPTGLRALNLGQTLMPPAAAPMIAGARIETLQGLATERDLGPWLLAAAMMLLVADLLISLALRGLLRRPPLAATAILLLLLAAPAHALEQDANPALATRLAWIVTGDDRADAVSRAGLEGLSTYVNQRTAASLAEPDPVVPGRTDLSFYPLLYWPMTPDAGPLAPAAAAALNDYMSRGGIILIDTLGGSDQSGGSGAGFSPGSDAALRRAARGLQIPPLAPLTTDHVLARSFYLLRQFPGRFTGATVWVQRDQDRANDSVSPVIIGANDWAAAWATDSDGRNPYAVIPGGAQQRTTAYRFGVNLVMYALTGNYKGDQVHIPDILERLGQ